jgi:hypothetical protein
MTRDPEIRRVKPRLARQRRRRWSVQGHARARAPSAASPGGRVAKLSIAATSACSPVNTVCPNTPESVNTPGGSRR